MFDTPVEVTRVDVVGSLIGDDGFQVHQVPHDGVFPCDPHSSQHLPRFPGNPDRHIHIVALGHGDLRVMRLVLVLEPAELQVE